jgi:hypothetical protein
MAHFANRRIVSDDSSEIRVACQGTEIKIYEIWTNMDEYERV